MKAQFVAALSIAAISLVGCKKEDPASTELGSATISGRLTADLDLSNDLLPDGGFSPGLVKEGISGVTVYVTVDTEDWDLNPDNSYSYPEKVFTTTTDANGNYSLSIPCNTKEMYVNVEFATVVRNQTQYDPTTSETLISEVEFEFDNRYVTIFDGAKHSSINEHAYANSTEPISTNFGTHAISGTIYLNNDNTNDSPETQYEDIPAGTVITCVYQNSYNGNGDWIGQGPTGGPLTIEIPINTDGTYSYDLPIVNETGAFSNVRFYLPELLLDHIYVSGGNIETDPEVYTAGPFNINGLNQGGITIDQDYSYSY